MKSVYKTFPKHSRNHLILKYMTWQSFLHTLSVPIDRARVFIPTRAEYYVVTMNVPNAPLFLRTEERSSPIVASKNPFSLLIIV